YLSFLRTALPRSSGARQPAGRARRGTTRSALRTRRSGLILAGVAGSIRTGSLLFEHFGRTTSAKGDPACHGRLGGRHGITSQDDVKSLAVSRRPVCHRRRRPRSLCHSAGAPGWSGRAPQLLSPRVSPALCGAAETAAVGSPFPT